MRGLRPAYAIVGYIYNAAAWCPTCAAVAAAYNAGLTASRVALGEVTPQEFIERVGAEEAGDGLLRDIGDSDRFPQPILEYQADGTERCDECGERLL